MFWFPWFSAHYLYPIRIRIVNDATGNEQWYTIAYVPWVRTLKEPGGKEKAKGRRWGVLQRTLYLAFRDAISASHKGHTLDKSIDGYTLAFFRVLLYACDRPEERSVLCLKAGKCTYPCTTCMVRADDACTEAGVNADERDVVKTLERHLEAVHLSRTTKKRKRRVFLETASSINAFVPALAALGGLGTVPHHLYKMIAFDPLHVRFTRVLCQVRDGGGPCDMPHRFPVATRPVLTFCLAECIPHAVTCSLQVLDLGVTRLLCHRLILIFSHVCKAYYPEFKNESTTARAGNTRTEFLGRRSLASFISPGYVVCALACMNKCAHPRLVACTAWSTYSWVAALLVYLLLGGLLKLVDDIATEWLFDVPWDSSICSADTWWAPKRSRRLSPVGSSAPACGFWPFL